MKSIIFIILVITSLSCDGQNHQFKNYVNEFKLGKLPLILNNQTSKPLFKYGNSYKQISNALVREFIDSDHKDNNLCRYDYGIRIPWTNNLIALIIQKQNYEGESVYDYDLLETVLIIYDKSGSIRSKQVLGKDNDGWLSYIKINDKNIKVKQAKLLEFDKDEMNCEIKILEYVVSSKGKIVLNKTSFIPKGKVIWDDKIHDLIIK